MSAYEKSIESLKQVLKIRSEGYANDGTHPLFFDILGKAGSLEEIIQDEFSRESLFAEIQDLVQKAKFKDWLPPKVKLSFVAAFTRDLYLRQQTRVGNYMVTKVSDETKVKVIEDMVNSLKDL